MENKNPEISVVMPVYNTEKYLDESISSILNQTFKDFEFIIINDGSTDDSLKLIEKYQKKDRRIILVNNKKNLGIVKSRNKGLEIAKGKYIAAFDADDISSKNRLERQYHFMEKNKEIYLCGASAIVIDEKGEKIGIFKKFNNPKKVMKKLLKENNLIQTVIIFRNTGEFFYREKFKDAEEYDFYLQMLSKRKKITNMPDFLVKFRRYESSTSFSETFDSQFFPEKIKEFYYQREKYGKDDYENFDPAQILKQKDGRDSFEELVQSRITAGFQIGYTKQVRKNIKILVRRKGLNKNLMVYYFLSWVPIKLIWFVKRKIS